MVRQEIAGIEVDPAHAVPDENLTHREPDHNIRTVLGQAVLPLSCRVIEGRVMRREQARHLLETPPLLGHGCDAGVYTRRHSDGHVSCRTRGVSRLGALH